jgi:glutamate--cysteine ligase
MAGTGVDRVFERRLAALVNSREPQLLAGGSRGLERESLRVTPAGRIASTPHPAALGSPLTNPHVTTDYSEALTELVTPAVADNGVLLGYLGDLHHFVYQRIGEELLWACSMPCELSDDEEVPIARYGGSHRGRVKHIYRQGLKIRYGGMMQAISGVHFNYSVPLQFWPLYREICEQRGNPADFQSARYFDLLRNYRRHGWLVLYLFGASPALCRSFLQGRADAQLLARGPDTLVGAHATSLRMSDIGYRNRNQAAVPVSVNSLAEYLRDLRHAMHQPHPPFAALGIKRDGEYRQLSVSALQVENEYYSFIRPKRVPRAGERTGQALARAGVEYVEVRALDNSVFDPLGVDLSRLCFLEVLLALLLLKDSPPIDATEEEAIERNHLLVARSGREPGLMLERGGRRTPLAAWAAELFDSMQGLCEILDARGAERPYTTALRDQLAKLEDPGRTPSARVLHELEQHGESFEDFSLRISREHRAYCLSDLRPAPTRLAELESEVRDSLAELASLEPAQRGSFEDYLAAYLAD